MQVYVYPCIDSVHVITKQISLQPRITATKVFINVTLHIQLSASASGVLQDSSDGWIFSSF